MLKSSDRALNACKPEVVRVGSPQAAWDARKDRTLRIIFWIVLSVGLLSLAFLLDETVSRILTLGSSTLLRDLAVCASRAGEGWVVASVGATISLWLFFR